MDQSALAVGRVDDDPRPGRRGRRPVEDADLVVDEVDPVELRVERPERLAERGVEGVHRAVAVGGGVEDLALHLHLDGRLGQQLAPLALLDEDGEVDDPERGDVARPCGAGSAARTRPRRPRRRARRLELLDRACESSLRVDHALELVAQLLGPDRRVRPAAQLRDDEPALVADQGRVDVLVAALHLRDRRPVDAALVGEGASGRRTAASRWGRRWRSRPPPATRSGQVGHLAAAGRHEGVGPS